MRTDAESGAPREPADAAPPVPFGTRLRAMLGALAALDGRFFAAPRGGLRRARTIAGWALALGLLADAYVLVVETPEALLPREVRRSEADGRFDPWEVHRLRAEAQKDARTFFAGAIAAAGAFLGLYLTYRRVLAMDRQTAVAERGHLTDRFTRAVDQLGAAGKEGGPLLEIRLGGIYALSRIGLESSEYRRTVADILAAYVRKNAEGAPAPKEVPGGAERALRRQPPIPLSPDIRAVLEELPGLMDREREERGEGAPPLTVDLSGANFSGRSLEWMRLDGFHLADANFTKSHLFGTIFTGADLSGASLTEANLTGADLSGANLTYANLIGANFSLANLAWVTLTLANLSRAGLFGADLTMTKLTRANLSETDLTGATLTEEQRTYARSQGAILGDEKTEEEKPG